MFEKGNFYRKFEESTPYPLQRACPDFTSGGIVSIQKLGYVFIIGASLFLLPSCEFEVPDLSIQERKYADSIYREKMKTYRTDLDTICINLQDSLVPIYIDSMYKTRSEEIERQLERVRNLK